MIRQKILQQLLEWIECNLEHPISIEDIAQKSGYSRRNIQLLFRNFMHVPLGEYIRKRRLCRAAILVRLTAKSMLDIALSLHFDSQQSFSREFKKLFGCSPTWKDRKSGSAGMPRPISYAVFCLKKKKTKCTGLCSLRLRLRRRALIQTMRLHCSVSTA